ncbi:hypothetical protein BJ741DRAFT_654699 [Chytriomyces cf. hyalinus JEL632]|nr:hypothetical protein BJ741DRAFT_654699 [Chytriomyces cf. hyalinus JEL632]
MQLQAISAICKRLLTSFALGTFSASASSEPWTDLLLLAGIQETFPAVLAQPLEELNAEVQDHLAHENTNTKPASFSIAERDAKWARIVSRILRAVSEVSSCAKHGDDLPKQLQQQTTALEVKEIQGLTSKDKVGMSRGRLPHRVSSLTLCEDMNSGLSDAVTNSSDSEDADLVHASKSLDQLKATLLNQVLPRLFGANTISAKNYKRNDSYPSLAAQLAGEADALCRILDNLALEPLQPVGISALSVNIMTQTEDPAVSQFLSTVNRSSDSRTNQSLNEDTVAAKEDFLTAISSSFNWELGGSLSDEIAASFGLFDGIGASFEQIQPERAANIPSIQAMETEKEDDQVEDTDNEKQEAKKEICTNNNNKHQMAELLLFEVGQVSRMKTRLENQVRNTLGTMRALFTDSVRQVHEKHMGAREMEMGGMRAHVNAQKQRLVCVHERLSMRLDAFAELAQQTRSDFERASHTNKESVKSDARAVALGIARFEKEARRVHDWIQATKQEWTACWEMELQALVAEQAFVKDVEAWIEHVCDVDASDVMHQIMYIVEAPLNNNDDHQLYQHPFELRGTGSTHASVMDEIAIVLAMDTSGDSEGGRRRLTRQAALERAERVRNLKLECLAQAEVKEFEVELKEKIRVLFPSHLDTENEEST